MIGGGDAPGLRDAIDRDPNEVQRGAADPTASVWVAASAGTGKTKVLTDRVLRLLLIGTPPERILCLTFTKAAAAEMNNRIADTLKSWASAGDAALRAALVKVMDRQPDDEDIARARRLFPAVLDVPGGMRILTIHAFCQTVLGRFPLEAGIAPNFGVLDDREQKAQLTAARQAVLDAAVADWRLAAALAGVTAHVDQPTLEALFAEIASDRHRLRAAVAACGSPDGLARAVAAAFGLTGDITPEAVIAAASRDEALDVEGLRRAAAVLAGGSKTDATRGARIAAWLAAGTAGRRDDFFDYVEAFLVKTGLYGDVRKALMTKGPAGRHPDAVAVLEAEAARLLGVAARWKAAVAAAATAALIHLGDAFIERYDAARRAHAVLDFDDLIDRTADLLESDGGASWVLYKLDGGIDHLLIDEAQDTSPRQWRVIRALTSEFFAGEGAGAGNGAGDGAGAGGRTVFAVGDLKQSIFSFQGADPTAFLAARAEFDRRVRAAGGAFREIPLQVSFRSTRAVLAAVDAVFQQSAAADGVTLDGEAVVHRSWRLRDGGSVELWPPVLPRPTDAPRPWAPPVERVAGDSPEARMAELLAARIQAMIAGEILESRGRAVRPGDIMVLVQRRGAFVEDLVRRLKLKKVPVAGVDRMILTEQLAVMDLMALGRFALLPADDLTLAAVLKSPLVGLDEDQLFTLAHGRGPASLWQALRAAAENDPAFAAARAGLTTVLRLAGELTPADFYAHVLGPMQGRARLLARLGWEADDPIAEFMDLALAHERQHPPSLQGFLHWVERTAVEVKRDLEQEAPQAVRVLTVHGAKGLQAPVVFLPDTLRVPQQQPKLVWHRRGEGDAAAAAAPTEVPLWSPVAPFRVGPAAREVEAVADRQMQEYRRLLYVAMTRAEDRLIIGAWRGQKPEPATCWYRLIEAGLATLPDAQRLADPFLAGAGEIDDADVLRLTCAQETVPDAAAPDRRPTSPALPDWARRPAPPEPAPAKPLAPSRPETSEPPARPPVVAAGDAQRFRRGRLIHRLLQSLPDHPPAARAGLARRWLAQPGHGLAPADQEEIATTALAVLAHPDCAPLFAAGSRAEVPLAGVVGGRVISGQVDRLCITDAAVTVLDFKTDRAPPADAAAVPRAYRRQMAAYRALLRAIHPDRPVRCILLWTEGPLVMPLPDALLDRGDPTVGEGPSAEPR